MVRINLTTFNSTEQEQILDFGEIGTLTSPIQAKSVSIVRFSIPNALEEIMIFKPNFYYVSLVYNGVVFSQAVEMLIMGHFRGNPYYIFEIEHLVRMFNIAFGKCIIGLNNAVFALTGVNLPTTEAPRVVYDPILSVYSIIFNPTYYGTKATNKITMYFNTPLAIIFKTMSVLHPDTNPPNLFARFFLDFVSYPEIVYNTNYLKITQESSTIMSYTSPRVLLITTQMPIEYEIQCNTLSSNQSNLNVMQSYVYPYNKGTSDIFTNSDFSAPADHYRPCSIKTQTLYDIKCACYTQQTDGSIVPMYLPPQTSASILLEFI